LDATQLAPKGEPVVLSMKADHALLHETEGGGLEASVWDTESQPDAYSRYSLDFSRGTPTALAPLAAATGAATGEAGDLSIAHWATFLVPPDTALKCQGTRCTRPDGIPIELPDGQSFRANWTSPDGDWVVVWSTDPSCKSSSSALTLAALSGEVRRHVVHEGRGTFHRVRWLTNAQFLFEADEQSVHQYDLLSQRSNLVVGNPSGLALNGLGSQHSPEIGSGSCATWNSRRTVPSSRLNRTSSWTTSRP
jgi:hypothetical protein